MDRWTQLDPIKDSHVYYYEVGEGLWEGEFHFVIKDWAGFRAAKLDPRDRLLALALDAVQRLPGKTFMRGEIVCTPDEEAGVARVEVSVFRFGLEVYRLRGHYALDANGRDVDIHIAQRYGPHGMPWNEKRASAVISDQGRQARYDMRLLGEPSVGVYQVDESRRVLDAEYHSEWAITQETMRRQVPVKPSSGPGRERWEALLDVARDLERRCREYDRSQDPRATFCHVYAFFVRDLAYRIEDGGFEDPDWVVRLAKAFSQLYTTAMERFSSGQAPAGWSTVLDLLMTRRLTILDDLALSMIVHIGHDLPKALAQVGQRYSDGRTRIGDYDRVNQLLDRSMDPLQVRLAERYNPVAGWLDRAFGRLDERLASEAIRYGRTQAWYDGERLADPVLHDQAMRELNQRIDEACRHLLGRVHAQRLGLRLLRRGLRTFRRQPVHPRSAEQTYGPRAAAGADAGHRWADALLAAHTRAGHEDRRADLDGLQRFLRDRNAETLLSNVDLDRMQSILRSHPWTEDLARIAEQRPQARLALAARAQRLTGEERTEALQRLGVDTAQAEGASGLERALLRVLREGFDGARSAIDGAVDALDSIGIPAGSALSALDDVQGGYDPETDTFTALAAAYFPVAFEDVAWIVDPERWSEVITHVVDSHWVSPPEDGRGVVYERVNILYPWVTHHPLVLETELDAEMHTSEDRVRVDYRLRRSLQGAFDIDEGSIEVRRLGENRSVVLIEKRLRVVGHALLYGLLRFNPDGLSFLLTHWIHDAARKCQAKVQSS